MRGRLVTTLRVVSAMVLSLVVSGAPLTPAYATFNNYDSKKPTWNDVCGTVNDTFTLPNVASDLNYKYEINNVDAPIADHATYNAWNYDDNGTVTIELYEKSGPFWNTRWDKQAEWSKAFASVPCDTPDSEMISFCHNENNIHLITTNKNAFYNAGHTNANNSAHAGDVYPAGSIVKQGQTYTWEARGDQGLLLTDCKPQPAGEEKVTYSAWKDGEWTCGDKTVTQTRTKTTTTTVYVFNPQTNKWVASVSSVDTTETQTRELTAQELKKCESTPAAPYFKDLCGTGWDWYKVPYTKGVNYHLTNGSVVTPGWHKVTNGAIVTITAEAKAGYTLVNYTGPWTHDFTDEKCVDIKKELVGWLDTNKDSRISAGDNVTWKITVTNLGVNPYAGIDVQVTDPGAVLEKDYKKGLKPGKSYDFTATTTLTAQDMTVCKVTNTASFVAGFNIGHQDDVSRVLSDDENESQTFQFGNFTGTSNIATWEFNCPPPQVLGEEAPTPPAVLGTSTAAVLPATGRTDTPLLVIAAAMLAYGAAYFIQGRRLLSRNNA